MHLLVAATLASSANDPLSPASDCGFRNLTLQLIAETVLQGHPLNSTALRDAHDALELDARNCKVKLPVGLAPGGADDPQVLAGFELEASRNVVYVDATQGNDDVSLRDRHAYVLHHAGGSPLRRRQYTASPRTPQLFVPQSCT